MGDFVRDESKYCNIPRDFADYKMRRCPICGEIRPKWLMKDEWKLLGQVYGFFGRIFSFKCPECGSILKVREGDVSGYAFSKSTLEGLVKKQRGKDLLTVYVFVEKIGDGVRNEENAALEKREFPLPELLARQEGFCGETAENTVKND